MDKKEAKKLVKEGLDLLNRWLKAICEIEDAQRPLTTLRVCVHCGKISCNLHGQIVPLNWIKDSLHPSIKAISTCLEHYHDWGEEQIFGEDFAGYHYFVLLNILKLSPTSSESEAGLFRKTLKRKLAKEEASIQQLQANGGLYPFLSMSYSIPPLRNEVWVCSNCWGLIRSQQTIETAQLMAKDITREDLRRKKEEEECRKSAEQERIRAEQEEVIKKAKEKLEQSKSLTNVGRYDEAEEALKATPYWQWVGDQVPNTNL